MSTSDWIKYQVKANLVAPPMLRVQRWRDEQKARAIYNYCACIDCSC